MDIRRTIKMKDILKGMIQEMNQGTVTYKVEGEDI